RRSAHVASDRARERAAARRGAAEPRSGRGARRGSGRGGRALPRPAHHERGSVSRTSAVETAAAVRSGERRAIDVLEEHLARIDDREGEIHAFNTVLADDARAVADALDAEVAAGRDPGPLAGVPIALKDNLCTRGVPTTCSSRILEHWKPPYDATVVAR